MADFVESEPAPSASEEYSEFSLRAEVVGSTWSEVD